MFLTGAEFFAVNSVIFRQSGLNPIHRLIIRLFWRSLFITPLLLLTGNISFSKVSVGDILIIIVLKSFIIGILETILFNYAVKILGAAESGAFGALTTILALLGGLVFLNEVVTLQKVFGVL